MRLRELRARHARAMSGDDTRGMNFARAPCCYAARQRMMRACAARMPLIVFHRRRRMLMARCAYRCVAARARHAA